MCISYTNIQSLIAPVCLAKLVQKILYGFAALIIRFVVITPNGSGFFLILFDTLKPFSGHSTVAGANCQTVHFVHVKIPSMHAGGIRNGLWLVKRYCKSQYPALLKLVAFSRNAFIVVLYFIAISPLLVGAATQNRYVSCETPGHASALLLACFVVIFNDSSAGLIFT